MPATSWPFPPTRPVPPPASAPPSTTATWCRSLLAASLLLVGGCRLTQPSVEIAPPPVALAAPGAERDEVLRRSRQAFEQTVMEFYRDDWTRTVLHADRLADLSEQLRTLPERRAGDPLAVAGYLRASHDLATAVRQENVRATTEALRELSSHLARLDGGAVRPVPAAR